VSPGRFRAESSVEASGIVLVATVARRRRAFSALEIELRDPPALSVGSAQTSRARARSGLCNWPDRALACFGSAGVLLQVSGPDDAGRYNAGLGIEHLQAAIGRARLVIAQVNPELPWTYGDTVIEAGVIDILVPASAPPLELPARPAGPIERAIAEHVARLIPDRATIEMARADGSSRGSEAAFFATSLAGSRGTQMFPFRMLVASSAPLPVAP
jgi:hypothetical protein